MATAPPPGMPTPVPGGSDPLAELRDLQLPETISAWPPAPGWWLLALLAAGALTAALIWLWLNYRRNRYRREALTELSRIEQQFRTSGDAAGFIEQYSALLKRVALTRFPRERVANLTGVRWVQFLDTTAGTEEFSLGAGQALIEAGYRLGADCDVDGLLNLGRFWIRSHRVSEVPA